MAHTTVENVATRVPVGDPVYNEIAQFLYEEAALLDADRFEQWLALLTEDVVYRAPIRQIRSRADGAGFSDEGFHFLESLETLRARIFRLVGTSSAWAEDPPSHCARVVTNILVDRTESADEFECADNLLISRHRFSDHAPDLIVAQRRELLRRTDDGWRLARRTILLNESVLTTPNLAIFL
jgi:3-phenylpropionate/cinnamic acid dioxygenase small subunit